MKIGDQVAGRYEILSFIGKGGFGWVYKARDAELNETVALKFLPPAAESVERTRQEIRTARRISHPNVIRIHDIGEAQGQHFISMEFLPGKSLREILGARGSLPVSEAIRLFRQVAEGVAAAHKQGVVHRDLKPANILVDDAGLAKVLDFGIATLAGGRSLTASGALIGTPEYMAPEQVEGQRADERSDIYSLGILLYELLAGRPPFSGDTPIATAMARLRVAAPDLRAQNPAVPAWLGAAVHRALERDPRGRFASVDAFAGAIRAGETLEDERPTLDRPPPGLAASTATEPLAPARPRWLLVVPAVLAVLGGALALWALRPPAGKSKRAGSPLLADGVARIAVLDFERLRDDEVSTMVASGAAEAVRARLAAHAEVRVIELAAKSTPTTAELGALGVEQVVGGRVARLGESVKVMVSVTSLPSQERWLTFEQNLHWDESWDGVDRMVDGIDKLYLTRLEAEKLP